MFALRGMLVLQKKVGHTKFSCSSMIIVVFI